DPDGNSVVVDCLDDLSGLPPGSDIPRIDSYAVDHFSRLQGQSVVKVYIGDERRGHLGLDLGERRHRLHVWDRHADDLTAGLLQLANLLDRGLHIAGVRRGHGLDGNRRIAADLDLADLDLPGFASRDVHVVPTECGTT